MKLWIDDFRDAPDDSWTEVRKVEPAIKSIVHFNFDEISIDHDIENRPDDETFKPVAYFIGEKYKGVQEMSDFRTGFGPRIQAVPKITIHSDNPVGAKELQAIFKQYGFDNVLWNPFTSNEEFKKKYGL